MNKRKPQQWEEQKMGTKNKPVHRLNRGAVQAALWVNSGKNGVYHRATFSRRYRTADGKPADTATFRSSDLKELALLAIEAERWIAEADATNAPAPEDDDANA